MKLFLCPAALSFIVLLSGVEPVPTECTCATAKLKGGWCAACKVGYLASVKLESHMLFEALDAHGHDIDAARFQCEVCKKAIKSDGYCDACRMGFFGGQAYLSRLTYHLARGTPREPSTITCLKCRKNAEEFGWCDECKLGMVGNVAIREKADFERAVPEFQRLLEARKLIKSCETCAVALFCGGSCPLCKKSYSGGKLASPTP